MPRLSFDRYLDHVETSLAAIDAAMVGVDPEAAVPGCPGWTAAELRDHCAGVAAFWTRQIEVADPDATEPDFGPEVRARHRLPLPELAHGLLGALRSAGPDGPAWNWSGTDRTAAWPARRMAHEFAVHLADAQAARGREVGIDDELAVDGIDELFEVFTAPPTSDPPEPVARLLIQTIGGPRWAVAVGDAAAVVVGETITPSSPVPLATVEGPAGQVLLALWGRPSTAALGGDQAAVAAWRSLPVFT